MTIANLCESVKQFFELNALLSRALKFHVASGNCGQEVSQKRFRVVRSAGHKEVMKTVNHPSPVEVVIGHHLVERPHGAFEYTGVFLTLAFPFPIVNPSTEGFF